MENRVRIFGGLLVTLMIVALCTNGLADTRHWTAPGDDGNVGTATQYSIRWAYTQDSLVTHWDDCTELPNPPIPLVAGSAQSYVVANGLLPEDTVVYMAIKTADEVPNWSEISNIIAVRTPDLTAPAAITDFR